MDVKEQLAQALALKSQGRSGEAQALCEEVIRQVPRHDDAHHLLAALHYLERRLNQAIHSIDTAISINPGKAQFFNLLGACYMDLQQYPAAELSLCHAIKLRPDYPDAYANLGLMLIRCDRLNEAKPFLEKALALQPNDANAMCHMAGIHADQEKYTQALQLYVRALELAPDNVSARIGKANVLQRLGRAQEALDLIAPIDTPDPVLHTSVLRMKGTLLYNLGRFDEACAVMDLALEQMSDPLDFYDTRAHVRKVRRDEAFFQKLQALEPRLEEFPGSGKTSLCYALGKAYQDVGDIGLAAKYYQIGGTNELQLRPYDEAHDRELFAYIKDHLKRDQLNAFAMMGSDSERPIFILGMERSGTTLVEQLLSSHSAVFAGGELNYVAQVLGGIKLPGNADFTDGKWDEQIDAATPFSARAQRYLDKIDALYGSVGHAHITDKMPPNFVYLGLIHALFPKARIIHCRRDPIDTCISSYTSHFTTATQWSFDLGAMGRRYRAYWELMEHWRTELPGRFLELRYEQVVENTEHYARVLLDWCGLPWEDNVMRFYENDRPVMTASAAQVRQPIYKSSMGRWKKWEPYIGPLLAEISEIEAKYWAELDSKKYG